MRGSITNADKEGVPHLIDREEIEKKRASARTEGEAVPNLGAHHLLDHIHLLRH